MHQKNMKEASYYSIKEEIIQCALCPHNCTIAKGKTGLCGVRLHANDSRLYSLVYGKPVAAHTDPIEKKPFFHFLPGEKAFSIGTIGCNLKCRQCQNWEISQSDEIKGTEMSPEEAVRLALANRCRIIAYTYNEPTIFFEYMRDIALLARKKGIKNVIVSNGYINPKPLTEAADFIDAANIDLKGFTDEFYRKTCSANLKPVLDTLVQLHKKGVWTEITTLIIPSLNDNPKDIKKMCLWIKKNLGTDVPLHFSAFHPDYKLMDLPTTSFESLMQAYGIAKQAGLKHVYIGNIFTGEKENTFCPNCSEMLIEREGFRLLKNKITEGRCPACKTEIAGVFQ